MACWPAMDEPDEDGRPVERGDIEELRYRAMGTDVHIIVVGGPGGLVERARERVDELDRRWSRFVESSELSRLNAAAGVAMQVSPDTRLLIERGIEGWRLTGGSFDPTVLGDVLRAGYTGDFDSLADHHVVSSALELGCERIILAGDRATIPAATGFDPGGIGKGLAADLVVAQLSRAGAAGACVNVGGDVRLQGRGPQGSWTVAVEHPWLSEPLALLGLSSGATATSTTLRRRWLSGGKMRHHLIDPATGEPSETDINLAMVLGAEAWQCEVMAKAVLLKGTPHPFDILGGTDMEALVVTDDGQVVATSGLDRFLGDAELPERLSPRARWSEGG